MKLILGLFIFTFNMSLFGYSQVKKPLNSADSIEQRILYYVKYAETINPYSMLINNKVFYMDKIKNLKKTFGLPDSITPSHAECCTYWQEKNEKDIWYGKTVFNAYKDSAIISEIYFDDGKFFIITPKIVLSKNTTYYDACKVFPKACKLTDTYINTYDKKLGKNTRIKSFCLKMCKECDDSWILFFRDNKLIRLDYFIPS